MPALAGENENIILYLLDPAIFSAYKYEITIVSFRKQSEPPEVILVEEQSYPFSTKQFSSHPSPNYILPSSHLPTATTESPQISEQVILFKVVFG